MVPVIRKSSISFSFFLWFVVFVLVLSSSSHAGPAFNGMVTLEQPAGISFDARQQGDEWYNWVETHDGYGISKNPETGNWEYYEPAADAHAGSSLMSGTPGAVVGIDDPAALGIPKGLRPAKTSAPQASGTLSGQSALLAPNAGSTDAPATAPALGARHVLVIGVDYANSPAVYTPAQIQPLFFGPSNSVAEYYNKTSYGAVTILPASESHGTVNDGFIGWLRLSGNHPNTGSNTGTANQQIARDAILAADPYIDYAQYDVDGNGVIDPSELSIIIIVAGYERSYSASYSPSVWGHQWSMWAVGYPVVDGKTIYQYAQFGERHGDHIATIGIMAHELGHLMFSLPDLYDTDPGNGTSAGLGYFDLMAYGSWGASWGTNPGSKPTQLSAWSKEYLAWGTVTTLLTNPTISFPKADGNNASIFRINTQYPYQYFLIENRQFSGYDQGFQIGAGQSSHGGLAIYHIDLAKTGLWPSSNTVNADATDKGVDVEEANEGALGYSMLDTSSYYAHTNMFYFQGNAVDFMNTTSPSSRLKNGVDTNITLNNVSAYGDTMTAAVCTEAVTYSLAPVSGSFTSAGGTGSVSVTASSSACLWTATSNVSWITLTSGSLASGSGLVSYYVAQNQNSSSRSGTITIAGRIFTVTQTAAPDTTPNPFSFNQTFTTVNTLVISNSITVSGIDAAASVSITGGEYEINAGGLWTSEPGTINNGNSIRVRQTSSPNYSTTTQTVLTIGGVSGIFKATTFADVTPDPFSFTDQTDAPLNTLVTSNTITITGITASVSISVIGGEYEINGGGTWTSSNGSIGNGSTVRVRQTSSPNYSTTTDTVLTIGGVSDTFSVTTAATGGASIIEDFETGNLTRLPWTTGGSGVWTVTGIAVHGGSYSAEAPVSIGDNQSSYLEVSRSTGTGSIAFWYSVSSEANYDYLRFYIDGVQQGMWSGFIGWTRQSYAIVAGTHMLRWEYSKDGSVSSGSDTAWIDDIVLITGSTPTGACADPIVTSPTGSSMLGSSMNDLGEIVWSQIDPATGLSQIYSSTRGQLTMDSVAHEWPSINNRGDVVWEQYSQIYGILSGVQVQLTSDTKYHYQPSINDSQEVIWLQTGPGDGERIYSNVRGFLTPADGWYRNCPSLNNRGDIVWEQYDPAKNSFQIYGIIGGTLTQITTDTAWHWRPFISNSGEVVWSQQGAEGTSRIYSSTRGQLTHECPYGMGHTDPSVNSCGDLIFTNNETNGPVIYRLGSNTPCGTEPEPNNTRQQAVTITNNATTTGVLDSATDAEDWYRFTANAGDQIRVSVNWTTIPPNFLEVGLLTSDGNIITNTAGPMSPLSINAVASYSGTYYVRLAAVSGRFGYALSVKIGIGTGFCADPVVTMPNGGPVMGTSMNDLGEIVWSQFDAAMGVNQIYSSIRGQLTTDANQHTGPSINNRGDVVWEQNAQIFGIISGVTTQLTSDPNQHYQPSINDSQEVIWMQIGPDGDRIYSSVRGFLNPAFDGISRYASSLNNNGDVVWEQYDPIMGVSQIYGIISGVMTQITNTNAWHHSPSISNTGEVVWAQQPFGSTNSRIYSSTRGQLTHECPYGMGHSDPSVNSCGDLIFTNNETNGPVIYRLGSNTPCGTEPEPNNTRQQAVTITNNATTTGVLDSATDAEDWYAFTAKAGDQIKVSVNWTTIPPNFLEVGLLTSDGNIITNTAGPMSPLSINAVASYSGTYYVRLAAVSGRFGYALSVKIGTGTGFCADPVVTMPNGGPVMGTSMNDLGEIVWSQFDAAMGVNQIYSSIRGQLTTDANQHTGPSINNRGDVVWEQNAQIFGIISGVTTQLTSDPNQHYQPSINDSQEVIWMQIGPDGDRIYSSVRGFLNPAFDGISRYASSLNNNGDVVWEQYDPIMGVSQIYGIISGVMTQITNTNAWHHSPSISNTGEVVWAQQPFGSTNSRIYSSTRGQLTHECPYGMGHSDPSVNGCGDLIFTNNETNGPVIYRLGSNSPCVAIVTPSAEANGSISPSTPQAVNYNKTASFTITPDSGYHIAIVTGCSGTLNGSTYMTGPITADCTVSASFAIDTFTVTPSAGANGSISPSTPQTVNYNQTALFTITPNTGYHIALVTGCSGTLNGNTYTTGPTTADCTVTATFAVNTYTVTPSAGANGSISPSTPQTVNYNQTASFTLTPNIGYHISLVTGCSGTLNGNTYTTGQVTADCTVSASFAINTYTVTPSAGANGSINPSTPQTVNYNQTALFTITSNTGYHIALVTGCSGTLNGNTYTTGPVNTDCIVAATFAVNTYTVTLSAGANGSINPSTPQTVNYNQTVSFTLAPNIGYHISLVTGCSGTLNGTTYTTGPTTADCTVSASFAINTYTVTPSAGANGSINPSTPQTVNYNQTVSFTLAPNTGYHIALVTGCSGTLNGNTYTTGPVNADCIVAATFAVNTYTVTPSAGANGSISPSTPQTVNYNQTALFTITPNTGYHIALVTGCSGTLNGNTYTTGQVTADCTVSASFAINTFTVTPSAGANGSINPSIPQTVNYNQNISFTLTPNTGYHIALVTGCSGTLNGSTYTTGPVTAGCTVSATFAINTYTVTPSAGANGSINPSTPQTVNFNQTAAFTITPNTGYHIALVTGCSGTLNGSTYTTGPITSACAVTATFAINTYSLTVTKAGTGSGTVTSSPSGINCGVTCSAFFTSGTPVTLLASSSADSLFAGWSGGVCSGTGSCITTMDAAKTVTATFNQYITVTSPNGGESWSRNSTYSIRWNYSGNPGSNVKIELLKGGALNRTLTSSTSIGSSGSGSYSWKIPNNQTTGTDYTIRVTSTSNSNYKDTSNANFIIK